MRPQNLLLPAAACCCGHCDRRAGRRRATPAAPPTLHAPWATCVARCSDTTRAALSPRGCCCCLSPQGHVAGCLWHPCAWLRVRPPGSSRRHWRACAMPSRDTPPPPTGWAPAQALPGPTGPRARRTAAAGGLGGLCGRSSGLQGAWGCGPRPLTPAFATCCAARCAAGTRRGRRHPRFAHPYAR